MASTHLISPEAKGKKFEAALKWHIPVVTKNWLLDCAKVGTKLYEKDYIINGGEIKGSFTLSNKSYNGRMEKKPGEATPATIGRANSSSSPNTPIKQIYNDVYQKDTPEICSQVTPTDKIIQDAIKNSVIPPPPSPQTCYPWKPKTPDTPIGAFIRQNPSPRLRKEMQKYINSFPDFIPPKRRLSTPLSELKRRLWDKVLGRGMFSQNNEEPRRLPSTESPIQDEVFEANVGSDVDVPLNVDAVEDSSNENIVVNPKLQELHKMVMESRRDVRTRKCSMIFESTKKLPGVVIASDEVQSQVRTVDWDFGENKNMENQAQKCFMISGVENAERELLVNQLKKLGGTVSDYGGYDSSCQHLICAKPVRNEKTLASIAAGKWTLHVSYVEKCVQAGRFLTEEEFEFGNPKSHQNIPYDCIDESVHYWRNMIRRRGYGAFNGMRAIVVAEKRDPLVKVIEAGGGTVINVTPPFDDTIDATHCLLEFKMVKDLDFSDYVPLARLGIKCINTLYISDFLQRMAVDETDYILPSFGKYYK